MVGARMLRSAGFAGPGLALAVVGLSHPSSLSYATSAHWTVMHLVGLPVFPLLGLALSGLVWRRSDPLAVLATVAAYVYATFYTALDVVSGIAAGYVTYRLGPGEPRPDEVRSLFEIGGRLGDYGAWAFLLGSALVSLDHVRRYGLPAAAPAALLVVASVSFLDSHIFPWRGVTTVAAIGVATAWLYLVASRRTD